jgi:hypothetical protein
VQTHRVTGSSGQVRNRITRGSLPRRLVDCRGSSDGRNTGGYSDCVTYRVSAAACIVFVGSKGIIAVA